MIFSRIEVQRCNNNLHSESVNMINQLAAYPMTCRAEVRPSEKKEHCRKPLPPSSIGSTHTASRSDRVGSSGMSERECQLGQGITWKDIELVPAERRLIP